MRRDRVLTQFFNTTALRLIAPAVLTVGVFLGTAKCTEGVPVYSQAIDTLFEVKRLDPTVVGSSIYFGVDTSIDGDLAGAISWGFGSVESSVNLYDRQTGEPLSHIPLSATSNTSRFSSIDISGDRMAVGSPASGETNFGKVLLFDISNPRQPVEIKQLVAPEPLPPLRFGTSVEFQGERLLVGADGNRFSTVPPGAAFLFNITDTNDIQVTTLHPQVPSTDEFFGRTLSMNDEVAIVGGISGKAYLFDLETGAELQVLTAPSANFDGFGKHVDISGDRAIVWSRHLNSSADDQGAAHLYDVSDPIDPIFLTTLTGDVPLLEKGFEGRVSLEGDYAILAARSADLDSVGSTPGAAYIFDLSDLSNVQQMRLRSSDGWAAAEFGISVDMDGPNVVIGAWRQTVQGTNAGAAYVFQVPEPSTVGLLAVAAFWMPRRHTRNRLRIAISAR